MVDKTDLGDVPVERLHIDGAVRDHFSVQSLILSSRTADCYKAVDKARNNIVFLWMYREPLPLHSNDARQFYSRTRQIVAFDNPPLTTLYTFAIDSTGVAFSAFPSIDGYSIISGRIDLVEGERRFVSALRVIERLHDAGVNCGDLCGSSFWQDRNGDVVFIGTMGTPSNEGSIALAPPDTLPFVAPEQRSGGVSSNAADVFALGVLGYHLLTKRFPYGEGNAALVSNYDPAMVPPVSSLLSGAPPWADPVLFRCLDPDPSRRYGSAAEVLRAILEARKRAIEQENVPIRLTSEPAIRRDGQSTLTVRREGLMSSKAERRTEKTEPQKRGPRPILLFIALFIGFSSIGVYLLRHFGSTKVEDSQPSVLQALKNLANIDATEALKILEGNAPLDQKSQALESFVESTDPIAHDVLVKVARHADSEDLRRIVESKIVKRARSLGNVRSAEQVRGWLKKVDNETALPEVYEPVLRVLDNQLPIDARASLIRKIYARDPAIGMSLAGSLALDSKAPEAYQPVLAQLVGDQLKIDNASEYSTYALILANADLSLNYGDDVIERLKELPDADIPWLLGVLATRGDILVRPVSEIALERGLVSPLRERFLNIVSERKDLPGDVLLSLVRASGGVLQSGDFASFGKWYDVNAVTALLACLADLNDEILLREAFDTLAVKSFDSEPASSLVKWIRSNQWAGRARYAKAIGVIANSDLLETDVVVESLAVFKAHGRDRSIILTLAKSNDPTVLRLIVDEYPDALGLSGLLALLSHPNKEIRVVALKKLAKYNDVGALKLILDAYKKEEDPEIQDIYRETFWVIREREAKEGAVQRPGAK